jgi:small-conductance mechanosensitive channel
VRAGVDERFSVRARVAASILFGLLLSGSEAFLPVQAYGQSQAPPTAPPVPTAAAPAAAAGAEAQIGFGNVDATPSGHAVTLTYNNRPITVLRARVLGHSPEERVAGIQQRLEQLVEQHVIGPVEVQRVADLTVVRVDSRLAFALAPPDVDGLSGETMALKSSQAAAALRQALAEAVELRTPALLVRGALQALAATALALFLLWTIRRGHRVAAKKIVEITAERLRRFPVGDPALVRASRVAELAGRLVTLLALAASALVAYAWLAFVLRRFPYTRPWGESLRAFFFSTGSQLGLGLMRAMPGLFTVAIIFLITRFFVRLVNALFEAVEQNRVTVPWVHAETAQPTRRLANVLLWIFALVVAYPYLPGSGTDAFKGVSVFLGLMISFGSSGLVNQVMSSFMITYSRALRLGDYVRVADVEGTVTHIGMLSTKIKTPRREEVTIPNAVLVSNTTTNYSKFAVSEGVYVPTSITIGYDTPWRQVEALLLMAADRTPGVRREPKPVVFQTALQDFYVQYTLLVSLERPDLRGPILNTLHANVQDAFNEHGVQIMSPNYEADPSAPKVVPRDRWFEAPSSSHASEAPLRRPSS